MGLSARVGGRRVRVGRATWMESQELKISPALRTHLARFEKNSSSSLCVAIGNEVVGLVAYSDGIRPESADMVKKLQAGGRRKIVLLSGDSPEVVKNLARTMGIDEAVGGLLPEQKSEYLKRLQAAGSVVAMVGDGINDAPALALAMWEFRWLAARTSHLRLRTWCCSTVGWQSSTGRFRLAMRPWPTSGGTLASSLCPMPLRSCWVHLASLARQRRQSSTMGPSFWRGR